MDKDTIITKLHHGKWWTKSWKSICKPNSNQILVPVILYMDGISLDTNSRLSLTPLNMTLGIFNTATRRLPEAWETIYFHPNKSINKKTSDGTDTVSNLHAGLKAALKSFKDVCDDDQPIIWKNLPYAGKIWSVEMKFAISFVIGDTQQHDQLCGRYAAFGEGVRHICRHCKCPTIDICNPKNYSYKTDLWVPRDFAVDEVNIGQNKEYFQTLSHHRIWNTFHELNFGSNKHNIHLATPGECLHMHQLGIAKRAVQSFKQLFPECKHTKINQIACLYGGSISRQSDRTFPRTKFGGNVLSTSMKEGKDLSGMLLCILLAMLSGEGNQVLRMQDRVLQSQAYFIELILGM